MVSSVSRQIQVYGFRVWKGREFPAFKNAVLTCVGKIIARLAGSDWVITPALKENPPALQVVAVHNYRSRRHIFWGHKPEGFEGNVRWDHVKLIETEFTPPYPHMPVRPFSMACRPLCGYDLRRSHTTCWLFCGIRRVYYGLLPKVRELEAVWSIAPDSHRRNRRVREALVKRISLIMEVCAN